MIDFVKYHIINTNPDKLEANHLLEFHQKVNTKTGEMGVYMNAYFKGLEFRIYESTFANPERRITLEGSLHKYWNNGAHNFNDFGINEIDEVINDLNNKFNIQPENCILKQLEIGVNMQPPHKTETILKCCLLHKTKPFKWIYTRDEGNYIQAQHQRHFIKIYDKQLHYKNKGFDLKNEIIRFEIKYTRMRFLNDNGIYNLSELLNFGLQNFTPHLLKEWNNVLFYDFNLFKGTKNEFKYSNPNYWLDLNSNQLKYHRNKLNKMLNSNPLNIKNQIATLIKDKTELLNIKTSQINPLYILLKPGVFTSQNTDNNRRFCLVTGLNISMQKSDSILLSHTGLKYYYNTDKKIYKEIKYKYLSTKWSNSDYKTEIKEIAHNIRNTNSNQQIKQQRIYQPQQYQLFDITI